ncbi:hypothetical protein WJX72_009344 [[Myrmecia] bisecta]|uniref:catalase n=1 Tax=[Myrmecia] bisecta TaxID=41462 RepID=A0AAW1PYK1_9CHLO
MVPGRALVVTVALLCLAAARAADVIPDTPPSFDDDAPETQYVIVVDTEGDVPAPEPPDGSKRVLMTDKTGRRFTCILPPADGSEAERGQGSRQMLAKHKSLDEEKPPSHYLDALAGLCFYRIEDWWTYEYCYKKHVRQFHKDKDVVESEYSLGTFDADQSDANTVQVLDASGVTEVKYVSNMYTNGEPCDITGQHRETEVRYLCSEDGQDQIASIKEPATCHYLLTLHTPRLCKHPQFHLPEPPLAHIVCIPYDPDPKPAAGVRLEDAMDKAAAADVPVTASESGGHGSMEHNDAASFEASLASGSGHGNAQQPPAGMGKPARHADIDYEALLGQDEVSSPLHLSPGSEGGSGVAEAEDVRNKDHAKSRTVTTNTGAPVASNDHSLTAGPRGPVLLEDYHLLEKLGQFNREKIPERVVHARGMTAKGYFEVTHDVSHLTAAKFLNGVGKKTPVAARFSTVVHERGSPESLRDVRGFSVKFYSEEGNWDFVGNDIPVFFIRDGFKFPDLVHALRPNPRNHIQEGWRALDFLAHHPESTHILTWLLDDNGIPKDWRHMEGFGVNTFKLVTADGQERLCKFHWRPTCGAEFLTDEDAKAVGEDNMRHSHATHDLFNAIQDGKYPEWSFYVQVIEPEDEDKFEFDPLDATKVWPEDRFPLIPVGKMVLNENIGNFHNESEQIAFSPGISVPGIAMSNDKLLQSRIHAYSDTQRYRLGANYQQLPINAPKCPYHNNHHDGAMNFGQTSEEVNYWPSLSENQGPVDAGRGDINLSKESLAGAERTKENIPKTNDFQQAGERWRQMDQGRRERFLKHIVSWMTEPKCNQRVRDVWVSYWSQCDEELGQIIAKRVQEMTGGKAGSPADANHAATKA